MGRSSRITRTFHNKPRSKITGKSKTNIPTPQTTKHVSGSGSRSEEPQRQTYNTPQAHAQVPTPQTTKHISGSVIRSEEPQRLTYKAKNKAKAINKGKRDWHSPLTLFASGMGNQAHDIGGSVHGLVTGQGYQVKSVLNRSLDHAFAGDWDSAGKVISDNPYRFAGNVATEVGLAVIPFGMMARGAGIAGRVGGAVSKTKKLVGGKGNPNKAKEFAKKEKTLKVLQHENIHMAVTKKASSRPKKSQRSVSNITTAYNRSNEGAKFPIERSTDTIKSSSSHVHKRISTLDQSYIQKGLPGSKIPSEFTQIGEFARLRAATGLPENQFMMMSSKYPVPNSVVNKLNKGGLVRGSDNKKVKSPFYYKSQFTPKKPFESF